MLDADRAATARRSAPACRSAVKAACGSPVTSVVSGYAGGAADTAHYAPRTVPERPPVRRVPAAGLSGRARPPTRNPAS